jgi:RNA polymerase sigma-70 factor (ECF subfamily)
MNIDTAQEAQLIEAAREGDSRAFDALVERYQEYLFRLMVRACHHPDDAEDITSAAFARAYEKLGQFEGRSSFVSWLGRIATNLCFRTREKAEFETVADAEKMLEELPNATGVLTPESEALQNEMRRILRAAVASLPEPDQTVLRLRDIEELSTEATAAKTGLSESAVKSRLHRARKALREKLAADFGV